MDHWNVVFFIPAGDFVFRKNRVSRHSLSSQRINTPLKTLPNKQLDHFCNLPGLCTHELATVCTSPNLDLKVLP